MSASAIRVALTGAALWLAVAVPARAGDGGEVVINGQALIKSQVAQLEARYRTRLRPGRYWYDSASGWWGLEGGPTVGIVHAGLAVGAPLPANASHGRSGVFINGRELHALEVAYLRTLGTVLPGRYWVDASGNVGFEGQRWAFANLWLLAQARQGGDGPHRTAGGGAFNSDGRCSYYQRRDLSGTSVGVSVGC